MDREAEERLDELQRQHDREREDPEPRDRVEGALELRLLDDGRGTGDVVARERLADEDGAEGDDLGRVRTLRAAAAATARPVLDFRRGVARDCRRAR